MVNYFSVIIVMLGSVLGALAAFLVKKGMNKFNFRTIASNKNLLSGIFLYSVSTIIYIVALTGEELTVLFPLVSTTYIWSNVLSVKYLQEKMNFRKWCSVIGIILGMIFIGLGS